jgi:ISXO2-like transposase domain
MSNYTGIQHYAPRGRAFCGNLEAHVGVRDLTNFYALGVKRCKKCLLKLHQSQHSIESVWAVLKRGIHGVYHHASAKHLNRYVQEFSWRLNEGNVKRHSLERLASFVDAIVGKRLTYKQLTGVPA